MKDASSLEGEGSVDDGEEEEAVEGKFESRRTSVMTISLSS